MPLIRRDARRRTHDEHVQLGDVVEVTAGPFLNEPEKRESLEGLIRDSPIEPMQSMGEGCVTSLTGNKSQICMLLPGENVGGRIFAGCGLEPNDGANLPPNANTGTYTGQIRMFGPGPTSGGLRIVRLRAS